MNLNLARKWRSRTFDEVVGQELPIRMLKNTLYLDHYFPVYLFLVNAGVVKQRLRVFLLVPLIVRSLLLFKKIQKKMRFRVCSVIHALQ